MSFSADQILRLRGQVVIRNVTGGPFSCSGYGGHSFATDEELDLLAETTPSTIRANDFTTACNMIGQCAPGGSPRYTTYELGACIAAGHLEVVSVVRPDTTVLLEDPAG